MRNENRRYYFSVEGETEQWYLNRLQQLINDRSDTRYRVILDSKVEKDPLAYVKRLNIVEKTSIVHVFDYESAEASHAQQFLQTLDKMKEAQRSGKDIKYCLGYSNFTFELWIILHKADCNGMLTDRRQYLTLLNDAYGQSFQSLQQYKKEDIFARILAQLTLEDVKDAIGRARGIMQRNQENGYVVRQYKGFRYYAENPSLSLWEAIEGILRECGLV